MTPLFAAVAAAARHGDEPSRRLLRWVLAPETHAQIFEISALSVLLDGAIIDGAAPEMPAPVIWIERLWPGAVRRTAFVLTRQSWPVVQLTNIVMRPRLVVRDVGEVALANLIDATREEFLERQELPRTLGAELAHLMMLIAAPATRRRAHRPTLELARKLRHVGLLAAGAKLPPSTKCLPPRRPAPRWTRR